MKISSSKFFQIGGAIRFSSWTSSPPYQPLLHPSDYVSGPPPTTPTSQTSIPYLSPTSNNDNLLLTPKSTPPPLTSPPPAPTQPSKLTSPLAINLDPIELLFSTLPTSPQAFLDSLEDLPPTTTNPPPPCPSFDTIERLANEPPPILPIDSSFPSPTPDMKPPIPPFPPQCSPNPPSNLPPLPPLGPNNPFAMLTHEMFCTHKARGKSKGNITRLHKIYQDLENQNSDLVTVGQFHWFWLPVPFANGTDETGLHRNHVRKLLRALPSKWCPKVTAIEESKDLSRLSLDELVSNLKVYEVVLEKDLESSKNKKEKYKSLALKSRQVLGDEDGSSSDSNDEEYAMAVRDFKKFFRRRGKFVRQPYDDKKNFRKAKEDKKED
ncbi:hypothetical protein Tco_0790614 [Tanacetum coccineum]